MAQHASRSSVELYTNLFFRGKICREDGYITRVMKNGVSVLVPKYGLESFAHLPPSGDYEFDPEEPCLRQTGAITTPTKELRVFSKVQVEITIDESSIAGLRQRLRMTLLQ
jgi:exosome complex exonuclease DIS3/RRP44